MIARVLFGAFGLAVLLAIALAFSRDRRAVDVHLVATGVLLQAVFAILVLKVGPGQAALGAVAHGFVIVLGYVQVGSRFVFGDLADPGRIGFVFAVQVLPTIVFFAALTGILYHVGAMQRFVRAMAWAITRVMAVSGAEATSVCASVFVGQTEAPLTIRPYLDGLTDSELLTVMVGGMAHVAGSVLGAYVGLLGGGDPERRQLFAKHLLTASFMAAPATLVVAKVLLPERGAPQTRGLVQLPVERTTANVIDAAATGAADGLRLALNVGAMLLAFVSLVALLDAPLAWLGTVRWRGGSIDGWLSAAAGRPVALGLATLLGGVFAPLAWVIGVPWRDAPLVGSFIGEKIVINEFVAYVDLSKHLGELEPRSQILATYALCGFANFASIAIQIGGIGGLAPSRRADVARLSLRALLGGSIATLMTATIAGVLA